LRGQVAGAADLDPVVAAGRAEQVLRHRYREEHQRASGPVAVAEADDAGHPVGRDPAADDHTDLVADVVPVRGGRALVDGHLTGCGRGVAGVQRVRRRERRVAAPGGCESRPGTGELTVHCGQLGSVFDHPVGGGDTIRGADPHQQVGRDGR
jgi:hypothetical protein